MQLIWTLWFFITLVSFIVLDSYALATGQWTLVQTVWRVQHDYPWSTYVMILFVVVLLWHFTLHRIFEIPILGKWLGKIIGYGEH